VVGVEQGAEIHRLYFVERLSIKETFAALATAVTRSAGCCARRRRLVTGVRAGIDLDSLHDRRGFSPFARA